MYPGSNVFNTNINNGPPPNGPGAYAQPNAPAAAPGANPQPYDPAAAPGAYPQPYPPAAAPGAYTQPTAPATTPDLGVPPTGPVVYPQPTAPAAAPAGGVPPLPEPPAQPNAAPLAESFWRAWTDNGQPTGPPAAALPPPPPVPQSATDPAAQNSSPNLEWRDDGQPTGPTAQRPILEPGGTTTEAGENGLGPSATGLSGPDATFGGAGPAATGYGSTPGAYGAATGAVPGDGTVPPGAFSADGTVAGGGAADGTSADRTSAGGAAIGDGENPYAWGAGAAAPQTEPAVAPAPAATGGGAATAPTQTNILDTLFGTGKPTPPGTVPPGAAAPAATSPLSGAGPAPAGAFPGAQPQDPQQAALALQKQEAEIKQAQEAATQQAKAIQDAQNEIDQLQAAVNEQKLEEEDMQKKIDELRAAEGLGGPQGAQGRLQSQNDLRAQLAQAEGQSSGFHSAHQQHVQDILNNLQHPSQQHYGPDGTPQQQYGPDGLPISDLPPGQYDNTQVGPGGFGTIAHDMAHQGGSIYTEDEIRQEQQLMSLDDELKQNMSLQTQLQQELDHLDAQEAILKANPNLTPQQKEQVNQQLKQIKALRAQLKANQALLEKQRKQLEELRKIAARNERDEARATTYLFDDPFMHPPKGPQLDPLCNDPFMTHTHPVDQDRHAHQIPVAGTDPFLAHIEGLDPDRHAQQMRPVAGTDPFLAHIEGLDPDRHKNQAPVAADPFMSHCPGLEDKPTNATPLVGDPFIAHNPRLPPDRVRLPPDRITNKTPVAGDPFMVRAPGVPEDAHKGVPGGPVYPVLVDPMMDHGWTEGVPAVKDQRKEKDLGVAADPFMIRRNENNEPLAPDRRNIQPVNVDPFLVHWVPHGEDKRSYMDPLAQDPFMTHNKFPAGTQVPEYIVEDPFLIKGQRPNIPANVGADPFLTKSKAMRNDLKKDPFLTRSVPNDKNRCAYEDLKENPLLSKNAKLLADVPAGGEKLEVDTIDPFRVNMAICINPGGHNEEVCIIRGFGSILLQRPLKLPHTVGEVVVPVVQEPHYTFKERVNQVVTPMKKGCRECEFGMIACFGRMATTTKRTCALCGSEVGTVPTESYLQPWLAFTFFLLSGLVLRHYYPLSHSLLPGLFLFFCVARIVSWFVCGRRLATLNKANMAFMCLIATLAAIGSASAFWSYGARQWWWMQTGVRYDKDPYNSAMQSATSRGDAAWIQFQDGSPSGQFHDGPVQYPPSLVDTSQSAGYVDGSTYCVAPVLSTESLSGGSPLTLVQYWAIGINCCEPAGSFQCGASRSPKGKYGIVMVGGGGQCAGCNSEKFNAAIKKAESLYGLVSADGALLVKWSENPNSEVRTMSFNLGLAICLMMFIAIFATLGAAWALYKIEKKIWDRQPGPPKPPKSGKASKYGPHGLPEDEEDPYGNKKALDGAKKDALHLKQMLFT